MKADVRIVGRGTVYLFLLGTEQAREWVDEHVSSDRQMLGCGLAVEHRYAAALAEGMQRSGLAVEAIDHLVIGQDGADCSWQDTGRL